MLNRFIDKFKRDPSLEDEQETTEDSQEDTILEKAKSTLTKGFKSFQEIFTKEEETGRDSQAYPHEGQPQQIPLPSHILFQGKSEQRLLYPVQDTFTKHPTHDSHINPSQSPHHVKRPPRVNTLPSEPMFKGGVPDNFWREIAIYPYPVSSFQYERDERLRKDIKEYAIRYQRSRRK